MFTSRTSFSSENIKDNPNSAKSDQKGPFFIQKDSTSTQETWKRGKEWKSQEFTRYLVFLEANQKKMENRPHRLLWKVYQEMERFIQTRNFRQCKSKHQKMLDQHKSVSQILKHFMEDPHVQLNAQEEQRIHLKNFYEENKNISQNPSKITINEFPNKIPQSEFKPTDDGYENYQHEYEGSDKKIQAQPFGIGFPGFGMQDSYNQKVLECHNIFLQWTGKLNSLFSQSQF